MSHHGPKKKISGSGYSTPQTLEQDETYCVFTAEMAVLQIQGIMQHCIDENKNIDNMGIRKVIGEKQEFDRLYSHLLQTNQDNLLPLVNMKKHVLTVMLPDISAIDEDSFVGKMQLCEKLLHAANSWPILQQKLTSHAKKLNYPKDITENKQQEQDSFPTYCYFEKDLNLSFPGYLMMYQKKGNTTTMQPQVVNTEPKHNNGHNKKKLT